MAIHILRSVLALCEHIAKHQTGCNSKYLRDVAELKAQAEKVIRYF